MPQSGETFNTIHRLGRLFQQYVVDMLMLFLHLMVKLMGHS